MSTLSEFFRNAFLELYDHSGKPEDYPVQPCSQEFNADYTFVLFPWAKRLELKPDELGLAVGNHLQKNQHIHSFEIVKGFLNFTLEP
ncbi:MAG TPA: hypothetical protein VFX48_05230, partial [Saprospiraceae bacterium]|nr:hypothetical protein [Saprospiraceae bacterium]